MKFSSISDTGSLEGKKIRVLPTGVEPITFWLQVQMLYHSQQDPCWENSDFFSLPESPVSLIEENIISHFFVSVKKYNKIPVLSPWLAQFCEGLWVGGSGAYK